MHALGQVAHVRSAARGIDRDALRRGLNEALPADIAVLDVSPARPQFHARHDALSRTCIHRISPRKNAFLKRYLWWVNEPLDVAAMARAARLIEGRHDFSCFCAEDSGKPGQSTPAGVESGGRPARSRVVQLDQESIVFRIRATHFLWRMVRRLAGVW